MFLLLLGSVALIQPVWEPVFPSIPGTTGAKVTLFLVVTCKARATALLTPSRNSASPRFCVTFFCWLFTALYFNFTSPSVAINGFYSYWVCSRASLPTALPCLLMFIFMGTVTRPSKKPRKKLWQTPISQSQMPLQGQGQSVPRQDQHVCQGLGWKLMEHQTGEAEKKFNKGDIYKG